MIYKTLHRKLKKEQHKPQEKPGVISSDPEGLAVPDTRVTPVLLLLTTQKEGGSLLNKSLDIPVKLRFQQRFYWNFCQNKPKFAKSSELTIS